MDEKVNMLLLWQLLHANVVCNEVDCGKCYAETGCRYCPKMDGNLLHNAKIVADAIKKYILDYLPDKTEASVEEVLDLLQNKIGEQDDKHN